MVEDEARAVEESEQDADGPEDVGRVAALDGGESAAARSFYRHPQCCTKGVHVFPHERGRPASSRMRLILVELNPFV